MILLVSILTLVDVDEEEDVSTLSAVMGSSSGEENFCLRWNDFQDNVTGAFRDIRSQEDFFDVTLACPDGDREDLLRPLRAHKLILSACSPLLRRMLRGLASLPGAASAAAAPLLYLRGVRRRDLEYVLDFMYHGEVNVAQSDLKSFLAVAEELQVRGLTESKDKDEASPVIKRRPSSGGGSGGGGVRSAPSASAPAASSAAAPPYRPGPASKKRRPNHRQDEDQLQEMVKEEQGVDGGGGGGVDDDDDDIHFASVEEGVEGEQDGEAEEGLEQEDYDDNYDDEYGGGEGDYAEEEDEGDMADDDHAHAAAAAVRAGGQEDARKGKMLFA